MTTTDAALVSRAQDGDEEAFRALYERHRPAVERVCRKWLRDRHLAEDAVQATFLKAWTALPAFVGGSEVDRWLRRIAKNHCHDVWRGIARAQAIGGTEDPTTERPDTAGSQATVDLVDRLAVEQMLRNLGQRDAALLVQRHIGGESVGALATQWGLTRGAMDVALHRARQRARRLAEAEGLRGLLPLGLLRRLTASLQRFGVPAGDVSVVLMGVCNVAIAVTLAAPELAPAFADERHPVPDATQEAVAPPALSLPAADKPATRQSPSATIVSAGSRARAGSTGDGRADFVASWGQPVNATSDDGPRHRAMVDFNPITVPAGGPTVSSNADYEPARRIGVRVAGREAAYDEDPNSNFDKTAKPVYDAGCTAAKAGDPMMFCED